MMIHETEDSLVTWLDLAVYLRPGLQLAIHWQPALTWRFTSNPPERYDTLVTRRTGQMNDKAQGPEGRFMLMVGRFKRKGMRNFPLRGQTRITLVID